MIIIDHTILLLYFAGDVRVAKIIDFINEGKEEGCIYDGSMIELTDRLSKIFEYQEAVKRLEAVKNSNIKIIGFDYEISKKALKIKNIYNLSILHAYIVALASHYNATLMTTDKRLLIEGLKVDYVEPIIKSHV